MDLEHFKVSGGLVFFCLTFTMTIDVNIKNSQLHKCYTCKEMFNRKDSLEVHKEKVHGEEETVRGTSFGDM